MKFANVAKSLGYKYTDSVETEDELREAILELHEAFHPVWGQLFKAGHQNSRWAQQVEDYACLYTSHVSNLADASPEVSFRALSDLMPHDRGIKP